MDHWAELYRLMSNVLQTVSFSDPVEEDAEKSLDSASGEG